MTDRRLHGWLLQQGLGRYATVFEENGVDWDVVPDLTEDDLVSLDIPLGHRKKLLKAICALFPTAAAVPSYGTGLSDEPRMAPLAPQSAQSPVGVTGSAHQGVPPRQGERRQLTVMFCDMVGSTELSRRLDPEDMMAVIQAYQKTCAAVIADLRGSIAQYLGDGILAYFGFPQAHEDDAERAIRAGLGIIAALGPLNSRLTRDKHVTVAVRVGIATGRVVIGDLLGGASGEERTAIGETPNLAARMQSLAAPDTILIADATHDLVGSRFEYEALGPLMLSGFDEPQPVWRVIRTRDTESRFATARRDRLSPFVGRRPELATLLTCWYRTIGGEGQTVVITGEPGIGKSRLLLAFEDEIAETPHALVRLQCSPFHQNSAFHPVIDHIGRAAGFDDRDDNGTMLRKLEQWMAATSRQQDLTISLYAALLSISTAGRYKRLDITPPKQKELTFAALSAHLRDAARMRPVVVTIEDLQWIDPSTDEFIESVHEEIRALPVMIVATCRLGYRPSLASLPDSVICRLERLSRQPTQDMIHALLDGRDLSQAVFDQIVERTEGIPLFIEELTKAVLQSAAVQGEKRSGRCRGQFPQPSMTR